MADKSRLDCPTGVASDLLNIWFWENALGQIVRPHVERLFEPIMMLEFQN